MLTPDNVGKEYSFKVGDQVRKKSQSYRIGTVLELEYDDQLEEHLARVKFGDGTETCLLDSLVLYSSTHCDMWSDLANCRVSGAGQFRTLLTFIRLKTPPSPISSAFGTARVRFFPYQFKPLLKFLESPNQRLLIADDVGLGKTIEAGYVLREWRARQGLQNVLIVVPARLQIKWQQELARRFDESFAIVTGKEIRKELSRVIKGGELIDFNWITSYETMRTTEVINLLKEVRPSLDLLIMDEAHKVRNRETKQFQVADILKDCADAMVYLSATPVQTGIDNLYTLVSLLMPDTFDSRRMFDEIVENNRPLIRACQMISRGELLEAVAELETLGNQRLTKSLLEDPYFQDVIQRMRTTNPADRGAVVRLQRDVSDFSLLGHLLSRTRKSEVMEKWPLREAQNPHIELTPDERTIYDAVKYIVSLLNPQSSGWGSTMAALTAYRYTASCIPAAAAYFRERLVAGGILFGKKVSSKEEEDDFRETPDNGDDYPEVTNEIRNALQTILDSCPPPGKDSKFLAFDLTIRQIWDYDAQAKRPCRKIVVFSYFRRTLRYLEEQLTLLGRKTRVIHGDVSMDDRQDRIEEFLESPDINILLSSEVGGEGIDLQKACVVVNYDLPWNPMVVEQRIGRIDRIGQEAEKLIIVNLVADGTVEERILLRLYDRIGLFKESIGEMDEIIGPMELQKLIMEALSGELSDEQIQRQVELTARAAEAKISGAQSLSQEVDGLLAADQAFLDEINSLVRTRRVPDTKDLQTLLLELLQMKFTGIRYEEGKGRTPGSLTLGRDALDALGTWARQHSIDAHRVAQKFQQLYKVPVTFDADTAMEHPRCEFIQARHPLIQFAVNLLELSSAHHPKSFALRVVSNVVPQGLWAMGIWSLTLNSSHPETRLEAVACNLDTNHVLSGSEADELLISSLGDSDDMDIAVVVPSKDAIEGVIPKIRDAYKKRRATVVKDAKEHEKRKLARLRATWLQTLTIRRDAAQRRLELMTQRKAKDFALRMAHAALDKREKALLAKQEEFSHTSTLDREEKEIATLLILVVKG